MAASVPFMVIRSFKIGLSSSSSSRMNHSILEANLNLEFHESESRDRFEVVSTLFTRISDVSDI